MNNYFRGSYTKKKISRNTGLYYVGFGFGDLRVIDRDVNIIVQDFEVHTHSGVAQTLNLEQYNCMC